MNYGYQAASWLDYEKKLPGNYNDNFLFKNQPVIRNLKCPKYSEKGIVKKQQKPEIYEEAAPSVAPLM
jgi:ABC-type uncharacterized transport system ATPase subunit